MALRQIQLIDWARQVLLVGKTAAVRTELRTIANPIKVLTPSKSKICSIIADDDDSSNVKLETPPNVRAESDSDGTAGIETEGNPMLG